MRPSRQLRSPAKACGSVLFASLISIQFTASAEELLYKQRFLHALVERVPAILSRYDAKTGRFGKGIWICRDQDDMLPLAVVYSTLDPENKYAGGAKLLEAIIKAGDALIEDMDVNGQWEFRKKDGSTWGKISMPWTYSRWIRSFALIKDRMPAERRARWVKALTLGYAHIEKTALRSMHNITSHHAMGLYAAGRTLDRPDWCARAAETLHRVAEAQKKGGYWSEGEGPLVQYNFVYIDSLGTYYQLSGDKTVLPAIERGIAFHAHFTYPSGQAVETIDLRNPYEEGIRRGDPAFTLTPEGRAWLRNQWRAMNDGPLSDDAMALFILHGREGPVAETKSSTLRYELAGDDGTPRAMTLREGPWFVCLSAYTGPIDRSRWHQDRQNLMSIWHEKTGLIIGGGNTKLQPAWSNFTVGEMSLLRHRPGDEQPDFRPKGPLFHVPTAAALLPEPAAGLQLTYGPESCRIEVRVLGRHTLEYVLEASAKSGGPVLAHVTLMPHLGSVLRTGSGHESALSREPLELTAAQLGGGLDYAGCRFTLPATATLHWPALPHNPYRKDGRAEPAEGRIEIRIPFNAGHPRHIIGLTIGEHKLKGRSR